MEKQIEITMKKAFWDLIATDLEATPQRHEHLCKLIEEIGDKFKSFTPNNKKLRNEIDEYIDSEFLKGLFEHKTFESKNFQGLVEYIMCKIQEYSSPAHDKEINVWVKETRDDMNVKYSIFVPKFLEKVYYFLELIENEIKQYMAERRQN
mgnify:CR=1 FL=1|tara:strand:+ start:1808 stop:2257 length:450 start_codon:yes stop_codon:yes gene_type:complete